MLSLMAALLAALSLASTLSAGTSEAAGPAIISIDADPATPGIQPTAAFPEGTDPIVIDVVVQNAESIGAFEFYLSFDVIWLEYLGWNPGPFLGSTGRPISCVQVITENTLRLGCTSYGILPEGPSGDGVIAKLFFRPRITGETCFRMLLVETAEELGHALPTISQSGCVTTIPHTATPTATPTLTATATPTPTTTPSATSTRTPTSTASATVSASATTTQPSPSTTPGTPGATTRTTTPRTATPRAATPGPGSTVLVGTAAPQTSPTLVSTVLSSAPRPPSGPTGFPRAGASDGFGGLGQSWLISAMSLIIGVLLVLLLRRTFFDDDEQKR